MMITLHHPDGTVMNIDSGDIVEVVEHESKERPYTTVHFEDHYIVCVERIIDIQAMMGEQ